MKTIIPPTRCGIRRSKFLAILSKAVVAASALPSGLWAQEPGNRRQATAAQVKKDRMIVDRLDQAERYFSLHPAFPQAFQFLRQKTLAEVGLGKHEIEGDRLYCTISKGPGRKRADAKLEAHRQFIDIQYVLQGNEEMGWAPTADCQQPEAAYDHQKDIIFFQDPPKKWVKVPAGSFTIFFPEDAHAPLVGAGNIHKAVVKVAVKW